MAPTSSTAPAGAGSPPRGKSAAATVGGEAVKYAPKKKTSVTGGTVRGAASGAATGAAIGSVVPGVGTAIGGAAGAVVGGAAGGTLAAKHKRDERLASRDGARRLLVAEFVVCMIILALSPLGQDGETNPRTWMKRGSAMCALFLVLGLVSAGSPAVAKVSASFGGLVTLALLIDQRSIFTLIAKKLQTGGDPAPAVAGPPAEGAITAALGDTTALGERLNMRDGAVTGAFRGVDTAGLARALGVR